MNIINNYITQQKVSTPPLVNPQRNSGPHAGTKTSIFYINDLHGQVPKMQRLLSAAEHASIEARQNGSDILKLCSGDTFIGGGGERNQVAASFLDLARIDAEALGNHEFDVTASLCGDLLKNSKTKILGANINFPDNKSELSKKIMASTVIKGEHGDEYGVIGIQPPDMMSRIKKKEQMEGIVIDDKDTTINKVQEEVNKLKEQGLNKIILLSHSGNKVEKEIAEKVDGIDVILGGHSHDLIEDVKEGENLLYSPSGEPVIITQTGRDGNKFGVLNLEFDETGKIKKVQNNVNDTNFYSPNLIMSKEVDQILGESPKIGNLKYADPIPKNNLIEENPWADFVSDALVKNLDADICLINSANFRGSVDLGTVTERDIESIFPFNNKLFKVKLNEKDLVDAIKFAAKSVSTDNHKPGLLQVSGLTYSVDSNGNLLQLAFKDKNNQLIPININNPDPNKVYTAIYDEFLIDGGDDMSMLKRNESDIIEKYDYDKDKVTCDFIKSINQPFEVRKDDRIKIIK